MYDKIYRISFIDKEEFIGGDLNAPKWNKCPDKGIESFKLILLLFKMFVHNLTILTLLVNI